MGKELKCVKKNRKSDVYENADYIVRIKKVNGVYYIKNGDNKNPYWNPKKEDDELIRIDDAVILVAESKKTGKKSQKRCYQGNSAIDDFQDALDGNSDRFSDVLKKIDE